MKKIRMEIELEYVAEIMHGDDPESIAWFYQQVLGGRGSNRLTLHSDLIGDVVGILTVLKILGRGEEKEPSPMGTRADYPPACEATVSLFDEEAQAIQQIADNTALARQLSNAGRRAKRRLR